MYVFGPVPSRRLGMSIGVNNIPPKICSYSCAYCQIGKSLRMEATPISYYEPEVLIREVSHKLNTLTAGEDHVDYITIVADGEPTLDARLEALIRGLRRFGLPVAVITNASLMDLPEVQRALSLTDWVSVKIDSVDEAVWRRIDRPHRSLDLESILGGIERFSAGYDGTLATETMLVKGLNDRPELLRHTAEFIGTISPDISYISIPTRPPADSWVSMPDEDVITMAYQLFSGYLPRVELLIGYEGNAFSYTGDAKEDILSITAVHPMREDAVDVFLKKADASPALVEELVRQGLLKESLYHGNRFYVRAFRREGGDGTRKS